MGLKDYNKIDNAPVSDILIHARIKTENQLMVFSYSIWQDCPGTGKSTGSYMLFIKVEQLIVAHIL